ncbi:MAG: NTPase KAP [Gemmatimonadetes bacterium]|nr:NTPase KAP [Gemmatimonadota bacterium]
MFSGKGWLPVVGTWSERLSTAIKIIGKLLQRRKEGVGGQRLKIKNALSDLDKPIVVILDDIDRLATSEIRDIFKLVRLTANFPNIIYIVAFDRDRVEKALDEQGASGRDYLEKILQVAFDLPVVPSDMLHQQIISALNNVLNDIENPGSPDEEVWPDVLMEIIRPLVQNMRDVRRYAAAIHGTVISLKGQIALADLLTLEAIRVFLPDVFKLLYRSIDGLITDSDSARHSDPAHLKAQVNGLVEVAGDHSRVVESMINHLFPAGGCHIGSASYGNSWKKEWLKERRVAHEDILRLYLERFANQNLQAVMGAEQAWKHIADRDAFDNYLSALDPEQLQGVITSLEIFEGEFASEHVVPGTIVLLNLLPLPERERGMFDWPSRISVTRVVLRLLRSLNDPTKVEKAVCQILPELRSLSSKLKLIDIVGYQERVGHKLVSERMASEFEKAWREEVRSASVDALAGEHELLRIFLCMKQAAGPSESPFKIDSSPKLTLALLRDAYDEIKSQAVGSRAVQRSPRLFWDALTELYGDEATLKERIESLKAAKLNGADELLELADKYLGGWRDDLFK